MLLARAVPRVRLHLACGAPLVAILLASSSTSAAPRPRGIGVHLDYDRGTVARQCPEAKMLRGEVAAEIGHDPFTEAGPWQMRVAITRRKNGAFVATADLLDGDGATASSMGEMVSPDCRSLVLKALAVWISWELTDPPLPPPSLPAEPPPRPPPPPPHEDSPAPIQPFLLRFGLGAALGFGTAPRVALGVSSDVGIYWPLASLPFEGVSLTLGGRWDPPAAGQVPGLRESERVGTSRLLATLAPCAHWWKLYGCAVGELGQLRGRGEGVALAPQFANVYSAVGGRLGVEVPFAPHLGFRISGEILGTVTPKVIRVDEQPGWTTPTASGGFGAGLYLFF